MKNIWDKIFKNGPSKICVRQPLKILLGPFLNTLSHIFYRLKTEINIYQDIFKQEFFLSCDECDVMMLLLTFFALCLQTLSDLSSIYEVKKALKVTNIFYIKSKTGMLKPSLSQEAKSDF